MASNNKMVALPVPSKNNKLRELSHVTGEIRVDFLIKITGARSFKSRLAH